MRSTRGAPSVGGRARQAPGNPRPRQRPCRCPASTGGSRSTRPRPPSTASASASVGSVVQLVTNGLKITDYRPPNTDKPVDIILRVPEDRRTLNQIDDLEIQTAAGSVPIGNFVKRVPAPTRRPDPPGRRRARGHGHRQRRRRRADRGRAAGGHRTNCRQADFKGLVSWKLVGEDEERPTAEAFLMRRSAPRSS